ncbi:MAG: hypothetical protein IMZ61_16285 [Planctomycetes bacterium]|nr:hypothetical protein [Planctomycetota bacterium]
MTPLKIFISKLLAVLLWLISLILGLADIDFFYQIIVSIFARFWPSQYWAATLTANVSVVVLALVFIAVVIITSEFHYKHAGEPASWKLFAQTIGSELVIPVVAFFIV